MQSSSTSSVVQPEAILEWLQKEMDYRPLGPYLASSKASMPSSDAIRRVCRGNMIPIFHFLLKRVKSVKTVRDIRRNILVHGREDNAGGRGSADAAKNGEVGKGSKGGRRKEKLRGTDSESTSAGQGSNRETALQERESAEKEVERLRHTVRRQRKELKARMLEVSREEADRKRMLDERSNYRHKQVVLEAYGEQCDVAARIFVEYCKRLCSYVNQVKDAQRLEADSSMELVTSSQVDSEKGTVYSTVKGSKPSEDVVLVETSRERNIRKACELLALKMIEKIHNSFPAYEGSGIHLNPQLETAKLGIDVDGDIPDEVRDVILNCLRSPSQLLLAVTTYTQRLKAMIAKEIERTDVRADAETLRYKYENNKVMDASPDVSAPLQFQLYGNGNTGLDMPSKGTQNQLLERQKAHVQQFVATEDQLNKAAEAKSACQKLLKRLSGSSDVDSLLSLDVGGTSQNMSSLRQLELEVWAKEREAAGLKASLTTLMTEVQRLDMLCKERKEAEDSLKKKWKKIEEFDARRLELNSIYNALMRANTDAAAFWSQQPLAAREHASNTVIPACTVVIGIVKSAKDLIDKEVSAFSRSPDNSLYMLPSTPQALLESMGLNGSTGPEAVAVAEKNAALLTARAGSGDPSAIPSICRVSAALQYHAGFDGSEASLASVLESMEFCLKLRGSEACVLEDLSKAINLVHIRRDLVESGHALLNHAYNAQKEFKRSTSYCLDLASEQEEIIMKKWLPELRNGTVNAQRSLDDCKYVSGLLDEWWEQPASTVVDWVTVDGQNVAAWHNHVKQLLAYYDKELL
ncbi:AUGMIN subunit 5-like [Cynara cardunculus var. scolymus]|uniref:AUGMIN subunit 5-like n=1 Tax=Cynara cardunculus var. scolymus TaxID=59895 RepID=UPI000D63140D|nr:AUGMIN subunit 5-like [Cynara cardunculus var. scolymus]